ncbi:MAG: RNase adapter RapZ [Proteobacteria bacterium]|nr:RNase adapter RapZ [Pseudomonadota bacterium]
MTGLSGAGLTTALKTLQDNGFYCIDNLPFELLYDTLSLVEGGKIDARGFAFGMDIRDQRFASDFPKIKESLAQRIHLDVLFIESDESVLSKRYSSTRRRHPLLGGGGNLDEAIAREKKLLSPVRESANGVIDTTLLKPSDLSRLIEDRYNDGHSSLRTLFVTIASFGFKYGSLAAAESILDIRFLPNPFFDPILKHKTGLDPDVQKFVMNSETSGLTFKKVEELYRYLLPLYLREGKHFFRIGIGCTGGQHRSVSFAELLGEAFEREPLANIAISVVHRDIEL